MEQYKLALDDVIRGVTSWRVWLLLSWQDIKLRYRRSQLGPFWITISMAVTIYTMGFLYGELFKQNLSTYYPFLAAGMLVWALISSIIQESTSCFVESEGYIRQIKMPFSTYILRVVSRNFIIFLHNVVVLIPIMFYYHINTLPQLGYVFLGLAVILANGCIYGMMFALLGARYRDFSVIMQNLIQVSFYLTPIMWMPSLLPAKYHWAVLYNPFAQFIEIARAPLTGHAPSMYTIIFNFSFIIAGLFIVFMIFQSARKRIVYWI